METPATRLPLLVAEHSSQRRFAHFKLCAHFLQARSERCNLFLKLLYFPVLFEELVEQHRVYRLVSDRVNLSAFIADHQVRINLGDFLSDQTELGPVRFVSFVVEGNGLKREEGFAGLVHRFNILFESARGT